MGHDTEPNVHGDTGDPLGIMENIVTLRRLMESRGHCDTSGPHGTKESLVAQQGLMESRNPCEIQEANKTKCLLLHYAASGNQGAIMTLQGLLKARGTLWHCGGLV